MGTLRAPSGLPRCPPQHPSSRTADGSLLWTVTLGRGAALGEQVAVRSLGRKAEFYSRRLQRTFPLLVFDIVSRES